MRFADVGNIWTVDLGALSNADRGRVYSERAKQVVAEALASPVERGRAVEGTRFRRDYLRERIGAQPAVTTQNPAIKALLADTDRELGRQAGLVAGAGRRTPGGQPAEVAELKATVDALRRRVEVQEAEIADLRRQLRESGWTDAGLADHGRLPW